MAILTVAPRPTTFAQPGHTLRHFCIISSIMRLFRRDRPGVITNRLVMRRILVFSPGCSGACTVSESQVVRVHQATVRFVSRAVSVGIRPKQTTRIEENARVDTSAAASTILSIIRSSSFPRVTHRDTRKTSTLIPPN